MANTNKNKTINEAYNFISEINKAAYLDTFLLSNQVLSKNPFTNNFISRFINGNDVRQISAFSIIFKLFLYYFNSFKKFILYLNEFFIFFLNPANFRVSRRQNEIILIDNFFLLNKIKASNKFFDTYFPGLKEVLDKANKTYAYLPIIVGSRRLLHLRSLLKIIKEQKVPVIFEYQLLTVGDLLFLFYFILTYPIHVIKFARGLSKEKYEANLLRNELMQTIDLVTFDVFSRYLLGRRIGRLPCKSIKVISWYENQTKDKNLYKGLKEHSSKVQIYGAQLFLYPKTYLNIIPDENEELFGIMPDKIIVNGPVFIPEKTRLNYSVGPSLRYAETLNYSGNGKIKDDILALLPYSKDDSDNILRILAQLSKFSQRIRIKAHPFASLEKISRLLPPNGILVKEDIQRLFETAKIIIGSGSGALVEAISLGIPVIVIKSIKEFDTNYLLEHGRGVVWEEVSTAEELLNCINKFESILRKNPGEVNSIANRYKEMFFCNPTEENIIKAFDL